MGEPWGIGGYRGGGEKHNIKQIVKKTKIGEKNLKKRRNLKKSDFFLLKMV